MIHGFVKVPVRVRYRHISSGSSSVHRYLYFAFIVANKYISSGSSSVHRIKYTSYRNEALHSFTGYEPKFLIAKIVRWPIAEPSFFCSEPIWLLKLVDCSLLGKDIFVCSFAGQGYFSVCKSLLYYKWISSGRTACGS